MKCLPIHFDGEISFPELANVFKSAGYHVRIVGSQIIVSRVPAFLRRDEPSNVVHLPARVRKAKS